MSDAVKDKKARKAYRRFVAELAALQGVPADGERAAELAFFFTAGAYQSVSGKSCLQALYKEVKAAHDANANPAATARVEEYRKTFNQPPPGAPVEVASLDDVPEPERTRLLEAFRAQMRAQGKTDEEIAKLEADARAFERANKGAIVQQ